MGTRLDLADLADQVTIPTLPEVVNKLVAIVEDPQTEITEIAELIAQDAPITSKVLRIANSAVYGLTQPAVSALDAAKVVGARTLKNIALQTSVIAHYDKLSGLKDFDVNSLWRHSVFTGQVAQEVAIRSPEIRNIPPNEFYTCGLLHDIGKMVLLESLGEEYLDVYRRAREASRPLHVMEQDTFGFDHTAVGAIVASRWKLHDQIADVIRHHHGPRAEVENNPRIGAVALADQIAYRLESGTLKDSAKRLAEMAKVFLGIGPNEFCELVEWSAEALTEVEL